MKLPRRFRRLLNKLSDLLCRPLRLPTRDGRPGHLSRNSWSPVDRGFKRKRSQYFLFLSFSCQFVIKATFITILYLFWFLSFPRILFLLPAIRRVFFSFNPITCFRTVSGPAWLVASSFLFGFFCFSYSVYRRCYFVVLPLSHLIVFWCEMLAVLARVKIWGDWVGKLASWVGPIPPVEMVSSGLVHPSPRFL